MNIDEINITNEMWEFFKNEMSKNGRIICKNTISDLLKIRMAKKLGHSICKFSNYSLIIERREKHYNYLRKSKPRKFKYRSKSKSNSKSNFEYSSFWDQPSIPSALDIDTEPIDKATRIPDLGIWTQIKINPVYYKMVWHNDYKEVSVEEVKEDMKKEDYLR